MNYDEFATSFHKTRYSIWNQVGLFLDKIPKYSILLVCGCGNGKYAQYRKDITYVGNDTVRLMKNSYITFYKVLVILEMYPLEFLKYVIF